jgi:acyl-CoA thioester hydrolase
MGVVNNGVYLRFFEIGRAEWLRHQGLSYREIEAQGVMLPVIEATVRYRLPARYDDLLDIHAQPEGLRAASVAFRYELRRAATGELLSDGMTRHACLGSDGRPRRFPDSLLALLRREI